MPPVSRPGCARADALRRVDAEVHAWAWIDAVAAPPTRRSGPLAGVPFGVKDVIDVRGMPTRHGCAAHAEAPAAALDAACVALLRRAGAVPVGKTVTAELAFAQPGPTRNPWDRTRTPGGSSSGSAAAVAAGMVPLSLGTQTGGSVIRPAAFCGVVGVKASLDAVSLAGVKRVAESFDSLGWFARDMELALAAGAALLGGDARPVRVRTACFAVVAAHAGGAIAAAAQAALATAVADLRAAGGEVRECDLGLDWPRLHALHALVMHFEMARNFAAERASGAPLGARTRAALARGAAIALDDYRAARRELATWRMRAAERLARFDAVLSLGAASTAPRGIARTGDSACQRAWSALACPAVLLPTSFAGDGLPLGVQLTAAPGADAALLRVAQWLHPLLDRRDGRTLPPASRPAAAPADAPRARRRGTRPA